MSDDDAIINALLETLSEYIKRKPIIPSSEPSIETIEKLDDAEIIKEYDNILFGFHRLAINGLNNESNQPIIIDDVILICNGEIYNSEILKATINFNYKFISESDCEILIPLYLKFGDDMIKYLDGVFSFIIIYDG